MVGQRRRPGRRRITASVRPPTGNRRGSAVPGRDTGRRTITAFLVVMLMVLVVLVVLVRLLMMSLQVMRMRMHRLVPALRMSILLLLLLLSPTVRQLG